MSRQPDLTQLLSSTAAGESEARTALIDLTYAEVKRIAGRQLRGGQASLHPTLLVHEAYLSLFSGRSVEVKDRGHFFSLAAKVMRDLIVDHCRARGAQKRGGDRQRVTLNEVQVSQPTQQLDALDLCDALDSLATLDARQHQIAQLRIFGGLPIAEIAAALDTSLSTVEREWRAARNWLTVRLREEDR